jgi:hypothetical protein
MLWNYRWQQAVNDVKPDIVEIGDYFFWNTSAPPRPTKHNADFYVLADLQWLGMIMGNRIT